MIDLATEACWLVARISPSRSGLYLPDSRGVLARLIPVESTDGLVHDIVAYAEDDPFVWWLRTGRARLLGERALAYAVEHKRLVLLKRTPHAWLTEFETFAVCVLRQSERAALLDGVRITEDPCHAA